MNNPPLSPDRYGDATMSYPETRNSKEPLRTRPPTGNGSSSERGLPRRQSRQILEGHLDRILAQLALPEAAIDTGRLREMLLELSTDIQARSSAFQSHDYRWILERLTGIYAQGIARQTPEPFTPTAAAYAQVIETISREYPGQDYSEAIGQLFFYMSRLFRTQENSWKAVYKHILSIPDSVEAKQLLNRAFFVEIQEWAEAGVENLFSIRRDLVKKISGLEVRLKGLDRRIFKISGEVNQRRQASIAATSSNIIDLAQAREARLIASLKEIRQGLEEEKQREESIVRLIESDIREFEEKLRNTRRAYFVRPV